MNNKVLLLSVLSLLAGCFSTTQAQTLQEEELAIVYYMPQTQFAITIEYDVVEAQCGPFYQYAQRYLGTQDVILENETYYELTNIQAQTHTVADLSRPYSVHAQRDVQLQLLTLTAQGTLYGYNVPMESTVVPSVYTPQQSSKTEIPYVMPLMEEQLIASSIAKMAEGTAKQIYHIRETRLNILAGDVEHLPADGQAMQIVLDELQKQEEALTALFVGKKNITHKATTLYYTPNKSADAIIARFSRYKGLVDNDDLSGEPINILEVPNILSLSPLMIEVEKKPQLPSEIYYNLPGSTTITIQYKNKNLYTATHPIAQYGVALPLGKDLFQKSKPTIYFNTLTGNITSIQK